MPHFSKYNDAMRYDVQRKNQWFTANALNDLCDKISQASSYRMIVWDSFRTQMKDATIKISFIEEE